MPALNRRRKNRPAIETDSDASSQHPAHETMERLGDILRRRREQRGDDMQQVADYLCIRKGFLIALENSDYDELPADAYAVGFLRSYAVYLGFDGREAVEHYRREMAGRRRKTMLVLPTPIAEGRTPSAPIMVAAAVTALLIYGVWYGISNTGRAVVTTPPALPPVPAAAAPAATSPANPIMNSAIVNPPPAIPQQAASSSIQIPAAPPAPQVIPPSNDQTDTTDDSTITAATAASTSTHLVIRAEKESWVLVADAKGNTIFDHVMKPGEVYAVPDTKGLKLTTGNGNAIILTLDGADLPKLSHDSRILHDILLDPAKLKTSVSTTNE